jgi:hypothetical protein
VRFQRSLVDDGVPLAWVVDVPVDDPRFVEVQSTEMALSNRWRGV